MVMTNFSPLETLHLPRRGGPHGDTTGDAAKRAGALGRDGEVSIELARHDALAVALAVESADALDEARVLRGVGGGARGDGASGRGRRAGSGSTASGGSSSRSTTGDGAAATLALLANGEGLEHGVRLLGGGVDGEDHALSAVGALTAVEPCLIVLGAVLGGRAFGGGLQRGVLTMTCMAT